MRKRRMPRKIGRWRRAAHLSHAFMGEEQGVDLPSFAWLGESEGLFSCGCDSASAKEVLVCVARLHQERAWANPWPLIYRSPLGCRHQF